MTQISFVVSEGDSEEGTLWIVPQGAELPEIDSENYQLIKAEELKQKIKELFQKNKNL
ncbi:MAG: hypothetical protein LC768_07955 [Acidobacteria bacterium]|nr:hypothetical protein [Acidobacteriota bacterium]MCA1638253.1 hypothetical protein [Acidobacteriota bacterium]